MSLLNSSLRAAIALHFPDFRASTPLDFMPMLDLHKGELSSIAAIEIARHTRKSAVAIAHQLLEQLRPVCGGEWRVDAGYLVLVRIPDALIAQEARALVAPTQDARLIHAQDARWRAILGLVPDVTTPVYARLRLIACVALQALITVAREGGVWLGFEPEPMRMVERFQGVIEQVQRAVERVLSNEAEVRRDLTVRAEQEEAHRPSIVWTTHHYFDRLSQDARAALDTARGAGEIVVRMPSDGWLLARERVLSELIAPPHLGRVIERLHTPTQWMRWIFHAASPIPSGDLDPAVALYNEGASPLWNVQVLRERFERVVRPVAAACSLPALEQGISGPWRKLLMRAITLPVWSARVAHEGEVLAWSQVLYEFSSGAHAFLNAPELRRALLVEGLQIELDQIVASVEFGLSSILPIVATEGEWRS